MNSFTETDLIALHLGELSPPRARALRRALTQDPALAAESHAIAFTLSAFRSDEPVPVVDAAVLQRNWHRLHSALTVLPPPSRFLRWRGPIAAATGVTLCAGVALLIVSLSSSRQPGLVPPVDRAVPGIAPSPNIAQSPAPLNELPSRSNLSTAAPHSSLRPDTNTFSRIRRFPRLRPFEPLTPVLNNAFLLLPLKPEQTYNPTLNLSSRPEAQPKPRDPQFPPPIPTRSMPSSSASARSSESEAISEAISKTRRSNASPHSHDTGLSIGAFGNFTAAASQDTTSGSSPTLSTESRTQFVVPSPGVIATFHQQFKPALGYQVSTSYTTTAFDYGDRGTTAGVPYNRGTGSIGTRIYELAASYRVAGPHTRHVASFVHVGSGVRAFAPVATSQPDSYVFRGAAIAGVGVDYHLNQHWGLRAEYRGVFFKGPDFRYSGGVIPVITRYTVTSEPAVSLTYRFSAQKN